MARSSTQGTSSSQNGKKRKAKPSNSDDESEGSDEAASQAYSQKASRPSFGSSELRPCVNKIIQLLLLRDTQKLAVPRDKILKVLKSKLGDRGARAADEVLKTVKIKLKSVFGFELKEGSKSELYSDVKKTQSSQVSQNSVKHYFLVNALKVPAEAVDDQQENNENGGDVYHDNAMWTRAELVGLASSSLGPSLGLTMSVLGIVAMEKYKAKESALLEAMQSLGFRNEQAHPIHGDSNTVLKQLCNMMYLEKKSEKDEDGMNQSYYIPGLRAEKEITRQRIVRWIEKVFNCDMTDVEREEFLGEAEAAQA